MPSGAHDEFVELCALSGAGGLTEQDWQKLEAHLRSCLDCHKAKKQFEALVDWVVPAFAAAQFKEKDNPYEPEWSPERAEADLFSRLAREEVSRGGATARANPHSVDLPRYFTSETWQNVRMLYAAGILLFIALGLCAYRVGTHRGREIAGAVAPKQSTEKAPTQLHSGVEEQLSDAGHDREVTRAEFGRRDKLIVDLQQRMLRQAAEIDKIRAAQNRLENDLQASEVDRQGLSQQRDELANKLEYTQTTSNTLQEKLDTLAQKSTREADIARTLEARVKDLTRQLRDRETELEERDELLAHDRDIRELIGARDLYIAEVYDVVGTGETAKPYGRVFYTRGKSLIFYAYDLDQQRNLKTASAFQAWGRRGPDRQQAINLGIFYEDNASKKRWILKCDDPKTLAQIDAVFVTVEPDGGSHKPSSKPLLFAFLKPSPNHP
jgi:hypothetical protein